MRRAAAALADVVRAELAGTPSAPITSSIVLEPLLQDDPDTPQPRVLALVGSGDNGGDALYAAAGIGDIADVDVLLVGSRVHESAFAAAVAAGARRIDLPEVRDARYALVLDGILGIGASRDPALHGLAREAVTTVQSLAQTRRGMPRVIAVDLPSGLHPDTGAADEAVLAASLTVTVGAAKSGLARAPELVGEVVLVDLGLPLDGVEPAGSMAVSRVIPAR
ncbi:NAD(P)H-hydrate epimerase [Microbacterium sp. NEAU-LLC]|uniref:NAD(P)H-hydrate epimerase n=2 Tax=Microbacterium helvum TaxID=2773713 RepID=A0ABR8NJ32_9MICO|nr:NAD(P)H-hydrate epimerase [Microbacterium helvum]